MIQDIPFRFFAPEPKYSPVTCKAPKVKHKATEVWTAEMVKIALDNIEDELLHLGLHLCFVCSLRPGEALGLTWDCVNLENGYIEITKTLQRATNEAIEALPKDDVFVIFPAKTDNAKSRYILTTPKTESSVRKIFISEQLQKELYCRKQTVQQDKNYAQDLYEDNNLVFAFEDGSPIEVNLLNRWFKKWHKRSGFDFPDISIGNMRHSSLTYKLPLYNGDIKSVQGDSGHAQADVLLRVYAQQQDIHRKKHIKTFEDDFYSSKEEITKNTQKLTDTDSLLDVIQNDPELRNKVLDALLAQVAENQHVI